MQRYIEAVRGGLFLAVVEGSSAARDGGGPSGSAAIPLNLSAMNPKP